MAPGLWVCSCEHAAAHEVAKILPIRETNADLIGILEGAVNPKDDLFSTEVHSEAES